MSRYIRCRTCERPMKTITVEDGDTALRWDGHLVGNKVAQCQQQDCEDIGHTVPIRRYTAHQC